MSFAVVSNKPKVSVVSVYDNRICAQFYNHSVTDSYDIIATISKIYKSGEVAVDC